MDDSTRRALARGHVIDITTTGRRTGEARRIEIVFHNIDGRLYITGMARRGHTRAWLRNLEDDPRMTVHLKGGVTADLPASARVVTDEVERRRVIEWVKAHAWPKVDVDEMVVYSPLIEVTIDDLAA